jgi:TonB family protein
MKQDVLRYSKLGQFPGDFGKRTAPFLIISCALHLALVVSILSLTSYEYLEKKDPRKPIIVDFMEHKEGLSPEPASLSPNTKTQTTMAQDFRPIPPPLTAPHNPSVKTKRGKSAKVGQGKPEREGVSRSQREKAVRATAEVAKLVDPPSKPLPSARDLIPSLQDLIDWQTPEGRLHRAHFEQEGVGENPAQVQYDAYLSILKQRVKDRWNVSSITDVREATTVVWFVVDSDGSLQSLELARSSGRVLLDHKAMAAIRGSFPLQAPPKALLDENGVINIQFSFRYMVYAPDSKNPWTGEKKWIMD